MTEVMLRRRKTRRSDSRWVIGQSMSVLLERNTTTTARRRCPSGRSPRSGSTGKSNKAFNEFLHRHPVGQTSVPGQNPGCTTVPLPRCLPRRVTATTGKPRSIPAVVAAVVLLCPALPDRISRQQDPKMIHGEQVSPLLEMSILVKIPRHRTWTSRRPAVARPPAARSHRATMPLLPLACPLLRPCSCPPRK